jgi:sortase A
MSADRSVPGGDPTSGHFIVKPTDVFVLDDFGDHRLTLTACHPKYSARERLIVAAELVVTPSQPAPTAPPPTAGGSVQSGSGTNDVSAANLDEGLGGDPSARTPAILWGLLFFTILAGVWWQSQRSRRWPTYAIGALPLLIVLYVWFENLDRWMPAR